eukprot:COSAG02_NODE_4171_length_5675_cov_2.909254_1_plen_741_part_00
MLAAAALALITALYVVAAVLPTAAEEPVAPSSTFFVNGASGDDERGDGSRSRPFATLGRCAGVAAQRTNSGLVICEVAQGTYRETVKLPRSMQHSLRFQAAEGTASPVLSGLDLLSNLTWTQSSQGTSKGGCVFVATLPSSTPEFQQLFYGGRMMVEARWPNLDVSHIETETLNREKWAPTSKGSEYGHIVDPALAQTTFSWTGALATLQVAHQFFTWTRPVANHTVGSPWFDYAQDLPGLAEWSANPAAHNWAGNQYFLSGKLEALDAEGEWFLDEVAVNHDDAVSGGSARVTKRLYFYPPQSTSSAVDECTAPSGPIEFKARDFVFEQPQRVPVGQCAANESLSLSLKGLVLHGGSFSLPCCHGCALEELELRYPTYNREVLEMNSGGSATKGSGKTVAKTMLVGDDNLVLNVSISNTNNGGLAVSGDRNRIVNCLVENIDWLGTLTYIPLALTGNHNKLLHTTVRDFGNAGVVTHIPNTPPAINTNHTQLPPQPMADRHTEVAYCHIHHSGLIGKDTAALYTGGWDTAGLEWHHNWIHTATEKCARADDQSRNMSVHHNVIWDCGLASVVDDVQSKVAGLGLILKGNGHLNYQNTFWGANRSDVCQPQCVEKLKAFRPQYPREVQSTRSFLFNLAAHSVTSELCGCPKNTSGYPPLNTTAIFAGPECHGGGCDLDALKLVAPEQFDFRPASNSPLVDAGTIVAPYTDGFLGKRPDIGAYESGAPPWKAGCVGLGGKC